MAGSINSPSSSSSSFSIIIPSSSLLLLFNIIALLLLLLLTLSVTAASGAFDVGHIRLRGDDDIAPGKKVGARTEVRGVETDREVQELGHFCVEEHNRRLRRRDDGGGATSSAGGLLTFGRVVAAQRQVVSGIKYYLRIAAFAADGGERRRFDAVVVVKPWLPSRTLISFGPAAVDRYRY